MRAVADFAGVIQKRIQYGAFGQIRNVIIPGSSQPHDASAAYRFGFTGREWEADVNLYLYRARWYDPHSGTFLSEDPLGYGAGDTNLSRYDFNNPTHLTDPSGKAVGLVLGAVGFAIGTLSGVYMAGISTNWNPTAMILGRALGGLFGMLAPFGALGSAAGGLVHTSVNAVSYLSLFAVPE